MRPLANPALSNGSLFCEDFFHALFRNHPEDLFYLWTTGDALLPDAMRFEEYANVRRIHTAIQESRLNRLIRWFGYPQVDDLVETLAMKNGHLPWVGKFDAAFISHPFPLLLEENCFHVQFTNHLKALHFPEMYTKNALKYHTKKWYSKNIQSAHLNIVPSDFQKKELLGSIKKLDSDDVMSFGVGIVSDMERKEEQLSVQEYVREGKTLEEMEMGITQKNKWEHLPDTYFFVRGDIHSFAVVMKAFGLFSARFSESPWQLIIEEPFEDAFADISHWSSSVHILSPLSEEDRLSLLSRASVYIDPSVYDSEGVDVIRAMRCKVPVLSSCFGALPEVYDEPLCSFDPSSSSQLYTVMKYLYKNEELRSTLVEKWFAHSHAPRFSWDDITMNIMHEVGMRIENRENEE